MQKTEKQQKKGALITTLCHVSVILTCLLHASTSFQSDEKQNQKQI